MKIAYVDVFQSFPANSGNDWYTLQLLTDLKASADVHLYQTLKANGKRGYVPKDAVKQEYIEPRVAWGGISHKLEQLRPEMLLDNFGVASVDADVVFARLYSYHIARHIAKANNAPIVLVMQNVEWQYLKHEGYTPLIYAPARLYEDYLLKRADAVTTVSPRDYEFATAKTSAEKVFYVPYEPNNQVFSSDETSRYDYGQGKLNVLFYGSLDRPHNIAALEFIKHELIPKLKECKVFDSLRVNVFGSGTPPRVLDLKNDSDINFLGQVQSPGPYVRGADVVLVPVRNPAGVKVRVLEALSCNKRVIAFPEATVGLEDKSLGAVTVANTAEEFAEELKLVVGGSARTDENSRILPSTNAVAVSDVARYAMDTKSMPSSVHARIPAFSSLFR